jgi:hypothetical protein
MEQFDIDPSEFREGIDAVSIVTESNGFQKKRHGKILF